MSVERQGKQTKN